MLESYLDQLKYQYKTRVKGGITSENLADKKSNESWSTIRSISLNKSSSSSTNSNKDKDKDGSSGYSRISFSQDQITLYDKNDFDFKLNYDPHSKPIGGILKHRLDVDNTRQIEKSGRSTDSSDPSSDEAVVAGCENLSRFKRFTFRVRRMFFCGEDTFAAPEWMRTINIQWPT
ncbi:unnamed protein product [Gordionus sp. m RMFG-2023]